MRLILAAVLGGIVMFAWGAFSHMVLGLEKDVIKMVPNEDAVSAAMKAQIASEGVYSLPGIDMSRTPNETEMQEWATKYKQGPTAMIFYHTSGEDVFTPKQFGMQFASDAGAALLASLVLLLAGVTFVRGVLISTLMGLGGWVAILIPYWNWYRFPFEFIRMDLIDQIMAWFLGGLVIAFFMRRRDVRGY